MRATGLLVPLLALGVVAELQNPAAPVHKQVARDAGDALALRAAVPEPVAAQFLTLEKRQRRRGGSSADSFDEENQEDQEEIEEEEQEDLEEEQEEQQEEQEEQQEDQEEQQEESAAMKASASVGIYAITGLVTLGFLLAGTL